jgi:2-methylcitrate dehydratase PrpD
MTVDHAAAQLAERALRTTFGDPARRLAARATIDTLGVMVAGTPHPDARVATAYARQSAPTGAVTALGLDATTTPAMAAFVNGALAHVLDYDDVSHAMKGHPSAVLVPTLLALGEHTGATGRQLLDAYLAGFDTAVAVAAGLGVEEHYRRGWHATSTIGALAAAAAGSRLLGLDGGRAAHAVGMAASFAGGSRQNFGSTAKSLHVARAAESAVLAVLLASTGGTANPGALEGPLGFFSLYGQGVDEAAFASALGRTQCVLAANGLNVKKYPCCYNTHRAADAAVATFGQHRGTGIRSARVRVEPTGSAALIYHEPQTGLEAKFCGEYVVATALLHGRVGLDHFTEEAVHRPAVRELLSRVDFAETSTPTVGDQEWTYGFATIEVELEDGRTLRERVDIPRGDARNPLADDELAAKFSDCCVAGGWSVDAADELHRRALGLTGDEDVTTLTAALRAASTGRLTRAGL